MIQGAIFDADGTLLDSMSVWSGLAAQYLESVHKTPTPDFNRRVAACSMPEAVHLLKTEFQLEDSEAQIMQDIYALIQQDYYEQVQLKPGVYTFIKLLKENGLRLCVATSTDSFLIAGALRRLQLLDDFDFILTSRDVGVGKHQPDIYIEAMQRLDLQKSQVLVFEDALYAAKTALDAGFWVIGVYDPSYADQRELELTAHGFTRDYSNYDAWHVKDWMLLPETPLYKPYVYHHEFTCRPLQPLGEYENQAPAQSADSKF